MMAFSKDSQFENCLPRDRKRKVLGDNAFLTQVCLRIEKSMMALFPVVAMILIIVCIWTELAGAASASPRVVIAHGAMNARVAPLWVARDRGFFAKYGVTADTIVIRGSSILLAAMATNEIDVGYTGGTAVIGAVAGGADLKVLSAFTNRVNYDLMVRPGIKTAEDLRGKKFGIQTIGGTLWMGAILALEYLGLDAERDKITILAVGDQNVLAHALEVGTIDATVLDGVQSQRLIALGFPRLIDLNKYNLPILSSGFVMENPIFRKTHSWWKPVKSGYRGPGFFVVFSAET
jgi:drug/metabolite transporter superfamily protein YnfA